MAFSFPSFLQVVVCSLFLSVLLFPIRSFADDQSKESGEESNVEMISSEIIDTATISSTKAAGYNGIWFTLGQYMTEYGDKYSGGLGTYTAKHRPMAIYSPESNKTFFVYGGTIPGQRHLLAMASYYDHSTGKVPKPTIVHDKRTVNDPHDNPSICIDDKGYVWVFVSGRAKARPGFKYRSVKPYSTDEFERVAEQEFTYPQPWFWPGKGFLHCFTKYTAGRELYWETSPDGRAWTQGGKLVGFGGHYQISYFQKDRVVMAFNWHPGGNVDKRTNIYFLQTDDFGQTWKTIDGKVITPPLSSPQNEALVRDYQKEDRLVYIKDVNFDLDGNPVILFLVCRLSTPGPDGGLRLWTTARWTGKDWEYREITCSDHNYDTGSLYIEPDGTWNVLGPTDPGPQPWGTGGELVLWSSSNQGNVWKRVRQVTHDSPLNHGYSRRPLNAHPDFFAFWADGDPFKFSDSSLYFYNKTGDKVFKFPTVMTQDEETPQPLYPATP